MVKNHFLIATRNIRKNKVFSPKNIVTVSFHDKSGLRQVEPDGRISSRE